MIHQNLISTYKEKVNNGNIMGFIFQKHMSIRVRYTCTHTHMPVDSNSFEYCSLGIPLYGDINLLITVLNCVYIIALMLFCLKADRIP